jgi:YD repeat-containing protein
MGMNFDYDSNGNKTADTDTENNRTVAMRKK